MSVTRWLVTGGLLASLVSPALAEDGAGFVPEDEEETRREKRRTKYDIRLTSTTFGYREAGDVGTPVMPGTAQPENASPINRLFTDARAQVTAKHVSGSKWDYRLDTRFRLNNTGPLTSNRLDPEDETLRTQSGLFGDREIDVRELYLRRNGRQTDWLVGRQMVLEIAATKIDGIRFEYEKDKIWRLIGFGGFYPTRGSRSIVDDYPHQAPDPAGADPLAVGPRVLPVAVGGGGAYRYKKSHGAIGAAAILPLAEEQVGGQIEKPRVFVTSNGYWRRSTKLDVYHYLVFDLEGAGVQNRETSDPCKGRCRNVLLGANWHPRWSLRVSASLSQVDTETLNVQAKTRLEEPDTGAGAGARIQSNVEVLRIASQAARLGVSSSFKDMRFEVSVNGRLRRRPAFTVTGTDGTPFVFPESQAAELSLGLVDRHSFKGFRLFGNVSSIFGVGDRNLNRTAAKIARVGGSRVFRGGRGELEVDVSYVASEDDNQGAAATTCLPGTLSPLDCYGTSSVKTAQAGSLVFYQLSSKLIAVASVRVGFVNLTLTDSAGARLDMPRVLTTSGFLRLDYKFR
jgi:hypothetical protein